MKIRILLLLCISYYLQSCNPSVDSTILVENIQELNTAISEAVPGNVIVLKNGVWKDVQIKFSGKGSKEAPIVLRAETPGAVTIEGASNLQ